MRSGGRKRVGRWDGGTVGQWDGGTVGQWDVSLSSRLGGYMTATRSVLGAVTFSLLAHALAAQAGAGMGTGKNPVWDSVAAILQSPPTPAAGYTRFNFPRKDI